MEIESDNRDRAREKDELEELRLQVHVECITHRVLW